MPRSLPRPDNRLYLGTGGSGKTTLALRHAEKFDRVLFVRPDDSEAAPYPEARNRRELVELMLQPKFRLAYTTWLQLAEVEWANEAAWRAQSTVVVWEEAGTMLGNRPLAASAPFAFALWMRGRHVRCRVFACSQRPASVSADLRANVQRAVVFNTSEPDDVDWCRKVIGGSRETAQQIAGLEMGSFQAIDWHRGSGFSFKTAPFE